VFDIGLYNVATKSMDVQRWLNEEEYTRETDEGHGHQGLDSGHRAADDMNRHDHRIHSVWLVLDRPISGEALDRWLETLLRLRGPDLLRFKAVINVVELPGPLVAHGVQHVIYPPITLKKWPSDDRRTRMVFITDGVDERMLRDSLEKFADEAVSATQ
jgi:G3E family GTPase